MPEQIKKEKEPVAKVSCIVCNRTVELEQGMIPAFFYPCEIVIQFTSKGIRVGGFICKECANGIAFIKE